MCKILNILKVNTVRKIFGNKNIGQYNEFIYYEIR